jgi:hypothetical protein
MKSSSGDEVEEVWVFQVDFGADAFRFGNQTRNQQTKSKLGVGKREVMVR